jgi:hypothetical protein
MIALWSVTVAALLVAFAALATARRTRRQLAEVTHMYWQLKFDHGELKAKVDPPQPAAPDPKSTFVPLTRLRSGSAGAPEESGEAGSPRT